MLRLAPFLAALFLMPACGGEEASKRGKPDPGHKREKTVKHVNRAGGEDAEPVAKMPESFVLDDAYAAEHEYTLPAAIEFAVDGANLKRSSPPADQRIFLRLDRTTDDGRAAEDLMFTGLRIPMGAKPERVAFAKELVQTQGLARSMPADGTVLSVEEGQVAGLPAVMGTGEFTAANSGKVYASMVAIILPGEDGFSIMSHHIVTTSEVKTADDVAKKGLLGETLKSLKVAVPAD